MRIVVHGQQAFGKAVLEALLKRGENVVAVYVAPEKPGDATAQTPASTAPKVADAPAPKPHNALPLKIFFLFVSIGLFISTLSGLYMSYKYIRNKVLVTVLLVTGVVLPILLTIY